MLAKVSAFIKRAQEYTKFFAAVAGGLLTVGSTFIPAEWSPYVTAVLAAATAFSVYRFPNVPGDGGASLEVPIQDFDPKHRL